jgi:hypothetical protein
VLFTNYHGDSRTIAFYNYYTTSSTTYYSYIYLDDIRVEYIPSCVRPIDYNILGIGSDWATISWDSVGDTYEVYLSTTPVNPDEVVDATFLAVSEDSITFNGLTPNTEYYVYVRNICSGLAGNSEWSNAFTFRTACAAMPVPYTEDFESYGTGSSYGISPCWVKGTNSSTQYPYPYSTNAVTGSRSLYFYAYHPSSATSTPYYSYAALPLMQEPINNLMLNFNVRRYSTTSDYYTTRLVIGVMTSPYDIATFEPLDTLDLHDEAGSSIHNYEYSFDGYTGSGQYIAIYDEVPPTYGTSNYSYSYAYVDDIWVDVIPTCPRVTELTALPDLTSAFVNWVDNDNAGWNVEYDTMEFAPGTGHMTPIHVVDTFCTITGLDSATLYHIYVYPDCADSNIFFRHTTVTTLAASPATVPYYCDFEATGDNGWDLINGGQDNYWMVGNAVNHGGSQSLYVTDDGTNNSYSGAASYVFATRVVNFATAGSYFCSFDWKAQGESSFDFIRAALVPAGVQFDAGGYCGFDNASGMPTGAIALDGAYRLNLQNSWQTQSTEFVINTPGNYKVVFLWRNDPSVYNQPPAAIDNVSIALAVCPVDSIYTVSSSQNSVNLGWVASSDSYQIEYGPVGFSHGAGTMVSSATNSVTLTGLDALTSYDVYIRGICGTDTSRWYYILVSTAMCDNATEATNFDPDVTGTTSTYSPIGYSLYNYSYVQTIIDSADLAGLAGDITAFAFDAGTITDGSQKFENMTVYLANVSESDLSSSFIHPDATHTFVKVIDSASFSFTETGWHIHTFDTAFAWDGHSNILMSVKRDNGTYTGSQTFAAHTASASKSRYIYQDSGPYDITSVTGGTATTTVGNVRLISCGAGCHAPSYLLADTSSYNSLTFTWADSDTTEVYLMQGLWNEEALASADFQEVYNHTATFTGLTPNTQYTVGLRTLCGTDMVSEWVLSTVTTAELPCFAPGTPEVSGVGYEEATITWSAGGEETAWAVRIYNTTFDRTDTVTTTTYTATGLTSGVTYNVTVSSLCGANYELFSEPSDTVTFTTDICTVPTGVDANDITATQATITWTSTGALSYEIEYGDRGFLQGEGTLISNITGTQTVLTGLEPEMMYDVYVRGYCTATLVSAWSDQKSFTTPQDQGIDDVNGSMVNLYPNPASQQVTVSGFEGQATVSVVDMNGREVYTATANGSLTIDVSGMAKGAYFVRITGESSSAIRKLIVK